MYIATWNLNHQAGNRRVRLEAAETAITLGADVLVFTEFFPREHEARFRASLANAGWSEQLMSALPGEIAGQCKEPEPNRVLIASRFPLAPMTLELSTFDRQFPANLLGVTLPSLGLTILAVRVPAYGDKTSHLLFSAWDWIEATAASLRTRPAIIIGDLNVQVSSIPSRGGAHFRRILANGWHRAAPGGATFFGYKGKTSEIDHVLSTSHCILGDATCVQNSAISDHAALVCRVELSDSREKPHDIRTGNC